MMNLVKTNIGRLRIIAFLEGVTLLILVIIAVPMKYYFNNPWASQFFGPIHGAIFLLFLISTLSVAIEYKWKFMTTTWKVLLACFIPFGTFYIDRAILSKMRPEEKGHGKV